MGFSFRTCQAVKIGLLGLIYEGKGFVETNSSGKNSTVLIIIIKGDLR